jgi:uncharacterized protein YfiM (DUF2279 family)
MIASLAIGALAGALLNRFAGGGLGWERLAHDHGGPVRGRPIYYVALALALTLTPLYGLAGLACAANVLLWRLPGWYGAIDAGTHEHSRARDFAVMAARGLVAAPFFAWAAGDMDAKWPLLALGLASVIVAIAYDVGQRVLRSFAACELMAGAAWGVAYARVLGAL